MKITYSALLYGIQTITRALNMLSRPKWETKKKWFKFFFEGRARFVGWAEGWR